MVKIDGSFVRDLASNVDNQLFIRNLLGLADTYGMETVAECVETQEDARFLIGEGVKYLQGYYYGKPSLQTPLPSDRQIVVSAGAFGNNA
jgi:EAL domain-containing protein (putative c-di-GMP-specific phosphodiesterase class I)